MKTKFKMTPSEEGTKSCTEANRAVDALRSPIPPVEVPYHVWALLGLEKGSQAMLCDGTNGGVVQWDRSAEKEEKGEK